MKAYRSYFKQIQTKLSVIEDQVPRIETAAEWVANSLSRDGFIYTSGTGHFHMFAEEIFYQAGGLARLCLFE